MRVLVTGGAGYIGSQTVLNLLDQGQFVLVVDNLSTGRRENVSSEAVFVEACISDNQLLASQIREHQIDTVVHFAGSVVLPESFLKPVEYYENNVSRSLALLKTAIGCGVERFVFSSTAAVYAHSTQMPVAENGLIEPASPYGQSKWMFENMLRDAADAHQISIAILRYFNAAGADPKGRTGQSSLQATHLIKVACEAACGKRSEIPVYGDDYDTPDGTGIRDYIHVWDLADIHCRVLDFLKAGNSGLVLNCGSGAGSSVKEVVRAVEEVSGEKLKVSVHERRSGDPSILLADCTRARELLQWQPICSDLNSIVRDALIWERGHKP